MLDLLKKKLIAKITIMNLQYVIEDHNEKEICLAKSDLIDINIQNKIKYLNSTLLSIFQFFFIIKIYKNIKSIKITDKSDKKGPDTKDNGSIIIKKFAKENKALLALSIFFYFRFKIKLFKVFLFTRSTSSLQLKTL